MCACVFIVPSRPLIRSLYGQVEGWGRENVCVCMLPCKNRIFVMLSSTDSIHGLSSELRSFQISSYILQALRTLYVGINFPGTSPTLY